LDFEPLACPGLPPWLTLTPTPDPHQPQPLVGLDTLAPLTSAQTKKRRTWPGPSGSVSEVTQTVSFHFLEWSPVQSVTPPSPPRMPRAPQPLRSNSGSLAILAAMRRASSGQPGASPNPAGLILRDLGGRSRRTVSVLTRALGFNRLIGLCGRGYLATYEILPKPLHGLCPSRLLLSSFDVL
jgi:hypothetical protein